MKLLLVLLMLNYGDGGVTKIALINEYKEEARDAYMAKDYKEAIAKYRYLTDSLAVDEDLVFLNMAHAYYNSSDSITASTYYTTLLDSHDPEIRSVAYQQLGVISKNSDDLQESLNMFKQALRANPSNEDARRNYEIVKRMLEDEQNQPPEDNKDNQNQQDQDDQDNEDKQDQSDQQDEQKDDQQSQDQQDQQSQEDEKDQQTEQGQQDEQKGEQQEQSKESEEESENEGEEEEYNPTSAERLEEMNLSEEKARMILEALKNNEIQYIQQMERKATKRPPSDKPDW